MSALSKDLHERLRGKFNSLTMGRDDGAKTLVPDESVFFEFQFTEGANNYGSVVVSILDEGSIKVYFKSDIIEEADADGKRKWYNFLKDLRFFSAQNMLNYEAKNITKSRLDKADFDFLVGQSKSKDAIAMESKLYGSRQKSYQDLNGAKLIVQHTKTVDEEKMGSRSRNISAIYIENAIGERLRFENNYLPGARAMARHVSNGGYQNDEHGEHISEIMAEMGELKSFVRGVKRDDYVTEDSQEIIDLATDRYYGLKSTLEAVSKQKGYVDYFENYEPSDIEVDENDISDLKTKLTREVFDDRLESSLGAVSRAMKIREKEGDVDFNTFNKWKKEAQRRGFRVDGDNLGAQAVDQSGEQQGGWEKDPQFSGTSSEWAGWLEIEDDDTIGIGDYQLPEKVDLIPGGKWTYQSMDMQGMGKSEQINAMLRLTLSDIADRAMDNETQNFAAKMSDLVGSEGTPFGLKTIDPEEYKREKGKAVKLVKMAITQPKAIEGPKEDVESATYDPMQEYEDTLEDIVLAKEAKPDYLDFDGDGDKDEPMKKALADKKKMEDNEYGFQSWADEEEGYEQQEENPVYQSILRRILSQHTGVISSAGPEAVMDAIQDVADSVGDVEEIGSSDVSIWTNEVLQQLQGGYGESAEAEVEVDEGKMKNTTMQANKPRFERKGQELEAYANKFGGVDKKDMMKVAAMLKRGDKSGALKYAKTLDTDPKEYILNLLGEEVELDEGRTSDIHLEIQEMIEDGKSDEEISKVTGFSVKDIKSVRRQVSMEENEQIDLDQGHIDTIKEHAGLRSTAKSNFGINVGEEGYRPVSSTDLSKWAKLFN